jgi:hypothetical protein
MKPQGLNSLGVFAITAKHYETSQLIDDIRAAGNRENAVLVQRMASLFSYNPDGTKKGEYPAAESSDARTDGNLPFWKVYTPLNIAREIRYRISKMASGG